MERAAFLPRARPARGPSRHLPSGVMPEHAPELSSYHPVDSGRASEEPTQVPALRLVKPTADDLPSGAESDTSGDAELSPALEDVVRRFGNFIRRTAHRHNLAPSELEDVVQDARIRLWKALGTSDRIRQAPASYIYRTTMSAALDFIRRRRARREESLPFIGESAAPGFTASARADDALHASETQRAVVRAVELLVESRRAVVRMYLAGYEREEIADLLGWSEAKTRNLLYRGLADVRESLQSWGYGPGAAK